MEVLKIIYDHFFETMCLLLVTGWAISEIVESFRSNK